MLALSKREYINLRCGKVELGIQQLNRKNTRGSRPRHIAVKKHFIDLNFLCLFLMRQNNYHNFLFENKLDTIIE